MKHLIALILLFCSFDVTFAQRDKIELYVAQFNEIAIKEMIRTGVPASITLAQGILESQSGESDLVKRSNNHFGIKCKPEWTGARTYHDDDERGECFRVYASPEESYKDHSDFLKTRSHYNFLFKIHPLNYEAWANGLKKAGYATLPTYPQKLIKLIKEYNLDQYTQIALKEFTSNKTLSTIIPNTTIVEKSIEEAAPSKEVKEVKEDNEIVEESTGTETSISTTKNVSASTKTIRVSSIPFLINQTKVIQANEGTSLLAIANQFDITLSKLVEFNELTNLDVLEKDQLIFLEKKQKKGAVDFHIIKEGESLYTIAQEEGIRLENLLLYNSITIKHPLTAGDKLFLKAIPNSQVNTNKK